MKHLLTAYLALTLIAGTVSLLVLFQVYRRLRQRVLLYYIGICIGLAISVLHNLLQFYLGINVFSRLSPGLVVFMFSNLIPSYAMQALIPVTVHKLYRVSWEKKGNILTLALIAFQVLLFFTPYYVRYSVETKLLVFGPAYFLVNIIFISFIVYALVLGYLFRARLVPQLRRMIRTVLLLILVSLPGFIHDQTYFAQRASIDALPVALIFFPLFFLGLSIVNIVYGLTFLSVPIVAAGGLSISVAGIQEAAAVERLDALARDCSLSDRECDVARLVVEGLGNKQIASQLEISVKTVNNHVYNLFQKIGINSRFELMARLGSISPSGKDPKNGS